MKCRKCSGEMRLGEALLNTPDFGTPDFPGQTDNRGQTYTMTGPAGLVIVWKCELCGYSLSADGKEELDAGTTAEKKGPGRKPGPTGRETKKRYTIRAYPSDVKKLKEQGLTLQKAVNFGVSRELARKP